MGWFYGFKLHLVINDKGEIIQWKLTPGNVDDRQPLKDKRLTERLFAKSLPNNQQQQVQCNLYLMRDEAVVGKPMQEITTHMLQINPK